MSARVACALALALMVAVVPPAHAQPPVVAEVQAQPVASGLTVPVFLAEPDDGSGRRFVVDQPGQIRVLTAEGTLLDEPFLDLSDQIVELNPRYDERGLLGLAFHPGYRDNGRFFVYYSAPLRSAGPEGWDHTSHLSEFRVSDDPDRADPASERVVLEIDQPYGNHNAGHIGFGPDGYLYVPLGDGGNGGDVDEEGDDFRPEEGNGQAIETLLGSILRIDVDGEEPYAVPADNPFVGAEGRDEIYAYGFRNPYGLSFDLETGDLYAADAGQALYEEVNLVEAGGNYGWNIMEGTRCFTPDDFVQPPDECPDTGERGEPLLDPVVEYERSPEVGSVIVAGVMYRGDEVAELRDRFVFGDYGRIRFLPSGVLYAAEPRDDGVWEMGQIRIANRLDGRGDGELNRFVLAVSQDRDGELYVLTTKEGGPTGTTGEVLALRPADAPAEAGGWPLWAWAALAGAAVAILLVGLGAWTARRRPAESGA